MIASLFIYVSLGVAASGGSAPQGIQEIILNSNHDYAFMWWANGWRGDKVRCVQTSSYGMAMDVEKMLVTHFGPITNPIPYERAVGQSNDAVMDLPSAAMELSVVVKDTKYTCRGTGWPRLIESGRFLQRSDIEGLVFKSGNGDGLQADCRLEVVAWPDRLSMSLVITPEKNMQAAQATILFNNTRASSPTADWQMGSTQTVSAILFEADSDRADQGISLQAQSVNDNRAVPVTYDQARGWHEVELPPDDQARPDTASLQRIRLQIRNASSKPQVLRLNCAMNGLVPGMTGLVPMLRDSNGNPLPIPVQISKNWHIQAGKTFLYQGSWLHALTMLSIPAGFDDSLEFCISRNFWGRLPVASHAQLCLIGWGTDQLWDEAAIGSWGESICYDPDVCLNRSVIDDVRPLMVTQMKTSNGKWGWSNNVGGGDFLVYFNENNEKQFLSRMRTAYLSQGPNITDVIYSGISADGNISATMRVMTPRCDDINRAYHTFRYDVLKPTSFKRLAFYQVGADKYNDHQFATLARGNEKGLLEEWDAVQGGKKYHRTGIDCPGRMPWFSLHKAVSKDESGRGAWANRGLVIRSWKARLGGKDCPPFAASYGTEDGPASCNLELAPPGDLTALEPGDFVEATVELLVLPQFERDYYGPNEKLRQDLKTNENTWKPVFRYASDGALAVTVSKGRPLQTCPVLIAVDTAQVAEFTVTGGAGYSPVSFTELRDYRGWTLYQRRGDTWSAIDQSVFGNDFWQVNKTAEGRFAITFNVLFDAGAGLQHFRLLSEEIMNGSRKTEREK
ncbi:MAG: hypothetical protein NTW21_01310 [Verrucomicrobia bacterium]|nr:hypothetical protein [Verrucomicrobiota bacterium]